MTAIVGELHAALKLGYRVAPHPAFFPFKSMTEAGAVVHAVVDHGARAIFCSAEWAEKLPKGEA